MLTHYLISQGLSFKEAYQVSDQVRGAIQKRKTVSGRRMIDLVHDHARELVGDRPIGDGVFWAAGSRQILVEDEQGTRPFSREHLSRSFEVTGVDESQAYRIAERIAADFIRREETVVARDKIFKASLKVLASEAGEAYGGRYWIWNWFRNQEQFRPIIVLIGGASGVGKTSVGVALANLLRISRVASTDEIRQVMRLMISQDLMPAIHQHTYTAWTEGASGPARSSAA
jgi:2-phosphoglycerate kinase